MRHLFLLILFVLTLGTASAQNDSTQTKSRLPQKGCDVKLDDGKEYSGVVISEDDSVLVLATKRAGRVSIQKSRIMSSSYYFVKNSSTFDNTTEEIYVASAYNVISSNAFLFKKRHLEGSSAWFGFYNFNYNASEHLSIGLTWSLFLNPVALHIKSHFKISSNVHFGIEAFVGEVTTARFVQGGYNLAGFGAVTAKLTVGNIHRNATLYLGSALGSGSDDPALFYGIAGSLRINENAYVTGELLTGQTFQNFIFAGGLRTCFRPRISWMFGAGAFSLLNYITRKTEVHPFPYIGFSFRI